MSLSAHVQPVSVSRIPELDGIRGLAIILVVFQHYVVDSVIPGTNWLANFIAKTFPLAGTGVDLFFVLSGFLIGGMLMDHRNSANYFKSFYIRRTCRIIPLYFFCLAIYAALRSILSTHYSGQMWFTKLFVTGVPLWTYATFTQTIFETMLYNTGQINAGWLIITWSLVVEEQFYLILPILIWITRPSWLLQLLLVLLCVHPLLLLLLWMYHPLSYITAGFLLPVRADALMIGVVCAFLIRQDGSHKWLIKNRRFLYGLLGLFLAGAGYITTKISSSNFEFERIFLFYSWLALLYACVLLLAVTEKKGAVSSLARFPLLRKFGMIAYGIYLFHQAINGLMHGLLLGRDYHIKSFPDTMTTVAALLATLFFASFCWRFLEKPAITWGHSFLYDNHESNVTK